MRKGADAETAGAERGTVGGGEKKTCFATQGRKPAEVQYSSRIAMTPKGDGGHPSTLTTKKIGKGFRF